MFHSESGLKRIGYIVVMLCVLGGIISCKHSNGEHPPKITKVLLISIDTLRADYLTPYDHNKNTSPNIDRFAKDNILFETVTSQAPSTAISHKSILYSLYPAVHKLTKDSVPKETEQSPLQILQSKGFKTAAFVGGGQLSRKFGFARGFDSYWEAIRAEKDQPDTPEKKSGDRGHLKLIEDNATKWLDNNYKENFFLFVHTYEVHCPYNPPKRYADKYTSWYKGDINPIGKCGDNYYNVQPMSQDDYRFVQGLYSGSVNYVDEFIGRLIQKLKQLKIYDQTMIVFMADHGESLGERTYVGHNLPYQVQLHIPLIMHIPGYESDRIDQNAIAIDVMPTIFDVLGFAKAYPFQGRSLIPVINGSTKIEKERVLISEQKDRIRVRKGSWACIFSRIGDPREELYNVDKDPEETNNLASSKQDKVRELVRYYSKMLDASKPMSARFVLDDQSRPELDEATREQLKALGYVQ